jgi:hypothetical protein
MSATGRPGSDHRYVLLGLASGAPAWMPAVDLRLADLGSGHEFLPCAGIPDLLNRLDSGRPFSALLVDHRTVGLDRELISRAAVAGWAETGELLATRLETHRGAIGLGVDSGHCDTLLLVDAEGGRTPITIG